MKLFKIMKTIRTIKELFKPEIKCERIGHNYKNRHRTIMKKGGGFIGNMICSKYSADIPTCKSCGHELSPINEEYIEGYTSVSMSSCYWDEIRKKGYRICN